MAERSVTSLDVQNGAGHVGQAMLRESHQELVVVAAIPQVVVGIRLAPRALMRVSQNEKTMSPGATSLSQASGPEPREFEHRPRLHQALELLPQLPGEV